MSDVKASFEARAGQENKEIILSGSSETTLFCDKDWMMEAVSNLVKSPLKSYTPDLSVEGAREDVLLEPGLLKKIKNVAGVERVYGRMHLADIPARTDREEHSATLISYDRTQFAWAEKFLVDGSIREAESGSGVLAYYGYLQDNDWQVGDRLTLTMDGQDREVRTGYYAMAVFVYGFLIIIALVALINIINTIDASVAIRMNHYGVMRAVGMSVRQLKKIIAAEAAAYAVTGCAVGSLSGLWLHRFFYELLVTSNWGAPWQPPVAVLGVTVLAALVTSLVSVRFLAGKIERMSIVNVVNAG